MASWLEKLERREAAAREQIDELRARIEELSGRLAEQETVLSRLEITRETMTELLDDGEEGPVTESEAEVLPGTATEQSGGSGGGSPVGVRLIPDWSPQQTVAVLPRAYQDIVEVLADAVHPMRAHQLCSVLGLSTGKSKVEGFRSKLKRLSGRGWIAEVEPGLFAARDATPQGRAPGRGSDSVISSRAGEPEGSRP